MQSKITKLPKSRVKLSITLAKEKIKPILVAVYKQFADALELPGFRAGQAPRPLVIERVGIGRLQQEVLGRLLNTAYADGLKAHQLLPVGQPAVTIDQFELNSEATQTSDFACTIEVDVLPEVKLTAYRLIKVRKPQHIAPINDEDVEKVLSHLRRQKADLKVVDRQARQGDWVDISFKGLIGEVAQEKLTSDHYPVVIGSGVLVAGFEDQLVGLKKGGKKSFELTFKEDYPAKEFAGKKIKFEVAVNDLRQVNLPPLDDNFAKDFGHQTLIALRVAIRQSLQNERERKARQELESEVIQAALEKFEAQIPESLVESELDRLIEQIRGDVEKQGMPLNIYLDKIGKNLPQMRLDFRPQAEYNVRVGLMLGEVVKQEGLDSQSQDVARQAVDALVAYATK